MNEQAQMMNQHQMAQMVNPPQVPPQQMMNQAQMYAQWSQPPLPPLPPHSMPAPPTAGMKFPPVYAVGKSKPNWKGKKPMDNNKRKDLRRKDNINMNMNNMNMNASMNMNMNVNGNVKGMNGGVGGGGMVSSGVGVGAGVYQPPTLYELEQQNRIRARRFFHHKKKFNRGGPYAHAPRNTTSYIIRAKKSGGIASLVSPCPVTPAVLPTPVFSPSREALVDMAKEEWGVDGYGSMKGLIRLRSPGHDETVDDFEEDEEGGSSESDVEEHVEVERRLDHDLSRFEMIYPNSGMDYHNVLENRVDDQDTHIAQLEEENLILKERLYLMERELGELRRRMLCLERQNQVVEDIHEEVVENVSENDSEGFRHHVPLLGNKDNEEVDYVPRHGAGENEAVREHSDETLHKDLKELAVKENFRVAAMESNECGDSDGLAFNATVANKDEEHVHNLVGKLSEKVSEQQEPRIQPEVHDATRVSLEKQDETIGCEERVDGHSNTVGNEEAQDLCMTDAVATDQEIGDDKSNV